MLMAPMLTRNLLVLATHYQIRTKVAMSSIGKKAHSDSGFFDKLERGETGFTAKKYDEIVVWFWLNWPQDLPWPGGVDQPTRDEAMEVFQERSPFTP